MAYENTLLATVEKIAAQNGLKVKTLLRNATGNGYLEDRLKERAAYERDLLDRINAYVATRQDEK